MDAPNVEITDDDIQSFGDAPPAYNRAVLEDNYPGMNSRMEQGFLVA